MEETFTVEEAYRTIREYFTRPGAVLGYDEEYDCCCYRTSNGHKCAVGCLIPDEKYSQSFEGKLVRDFVCDLNWNITNRTLEFLERVQTLHDNSSTVERFVIELDGYYYDTI